MNKDILEGNWKQVSGRVREWWGRLTDDEIDQIMGRRDVLAGKLQEKYGYTREEAENSIREFVDSVEDELEETMPEDRPGY
jgi:uncharacterized protein YjbJ (UPF0337 family)